MPSFVDILRAAVFATGRVIGIRAENYPADHDFWYEPVGSKVLSGVRVDADTAMQASTVYACVSVISNAVAGLSVEVLERLPGGKRRPAEEHPLWDVLHLSPSDGVDSYFFWQTFMVHLLLRGNVYTELIPGPRGFADQLILLHPDRVRWEKFGNRQRRYFYRELNGQERRIPQELIWHTPGMSMDGENGMSVIAYARETIGSALAAERYGATVFGNDATPGVVLRHPGKLSTEAIDRLQESFDAKHAGHWNARKTAVLPEGMEVQTVSLSPEDTQWLEARKLSAIQIAQFFTIQQHMVGILERSTFNNIEQQAHEFATFTIRPWLVRIERSAALNLLLNPQRFKIRFTMEDLLRGDPLKRAQSLQIQRQNGVINGDEWRAVEGRNPIEDGTGADFWRPGNMLRAQDPTPVRAPAGPPTPAGRGASSNGHSTEEIVLRQRVTTTVDRDEEGRILRTVEERA